MLRKMMLPMQSPLGRAAMQAQAARAMSAGRVVVGAKARPRRERKAVLELTENAAARITTLLENRRKSGEEVDAVRVGIKSRGCNGLSYTMNYANEKKKLEEEVAQHGVRVFVESKALMHVIGTTMDYVEDELTSEFIFHNPNAEASCGCGESFTTGNQTGDEKKAAAS